MVGRVWIGGHVSRQEKKHLWKWWAGGGALEKRPPGDAPSRACSTPLSLGLSELSICRAVMGTVSGKVDSASHQALLYFSERLQAVSCEWANVAREDRPERRMTRGPKCDSIYALRPSFQGHARRHANETNVARMSPAFWTPLDPSDPSPSGPLWTPLDPPGPLWSLDPSGPLRSQDPSGVWTPLDPSGPLWTPLDPSGPSRL